MVEGNGMAIGWFEEMEYDEYATHTAARRSTLSLFRWRTGGDESELEQFTMQQMLEIIELGQSQSLDDSVSLLLSSVERWCGKNGPKDDVSILGLEIADEEG